MPSVCLPFFGAEDLKGRERVHLEDVYVYGLVSVVHTVCMKEWMVWSHNRCDKCVLNAFHRWKTARGDHSGAVVLQRGLNECGVRREGGEKAVKKGLTAGWCGVSGGEAIPMETPD